ncbi:MAG: DUF4479 and tRNA-binding domain-containing protein [Streptococcaceae bacterium]|nr:DUF4479 and tRNA-binding domain-containing protein [Streptococcaceae bacterium]
MIFSYNKHAVGDVLLILVKNDGRNPVDFERRGRVSRVFLKETGETVAWNIFDASEILTFTQPDGQITLDEREVEILNKELSQNDFSERIISDTTPKFVIGRVQELVPHPDSDHLNIAQVQVDHGEVLQIVAGAPNIEQGQLVVVAKVGAMMPNGLIIWEGELRGVASFGMLASPRELSLPNAPDVRGILVLTEDQATVGEPFDATKHWNK